jgi:hypothetical protein
MERAKNGQVQITVEGKLRHREAFDMPDGARVEISVNEV